MDVTKGIYRHFKGGYSLVEDIVIHSETKEPYVLYTLLDGSMQRIIRPLSNFTKKIDKEKYPEATQKYRFEKIDIIENKEDIIRKNNKENYKFVNIDSTDLLKGIYKHFKGDYYLVEDVVLDSETKEPYVYYRGLYGKVESYVRPYEIFMSLVDKEKYPEVTQKYRFEFQNIESVKDKQFIEKYKKLVKKY